ncbi:hypothetical protein C5167_049081, partial [Papaver somniferum]
AHFAQMRAPGAMALPPSASPLRGECWLLVVQVVMHLKQLVVLLNINGTYSAARLGFCKEFGPPLPFRCIKGDGGLVPRTLVGVTRVYPVFYKVRNLNQYIPRGSAIAFLHNKASTISRFVSSSTQAPRISFASLVGSRSNAAAHWQSILEELDNYLLSWRKKIKM